MSAKTAIWISVLSLAVSVAIGIVCFGDRFASGAALLFFVNIYGVCWPFLVAYQSSIRRRRREFIQAMAGEPHWIRDAVMAEFEADSRSR